MVSIWTSFTDSSTYVAMATNFGQNWQNDLHSAPRHFKTEYRYTDKQLYSANDPSPSCTNMVNFGLVTLEIEV